MPNKENQFLSDSSENESSSFSLELVVDNNIEEERQNELARENNIYNFDAETIKDKPWLKPGADITDYFNYGFTEKTWMKYCEQQRANRDFANKMNKHEKYKNQRRDRGHDESSEINSRKRMKADKDDEFGRMDHRYNRDQNSEAGELKNEYDDWRYNEKRDYSGRRGYERDFGYRRRDERPQRDRRYDDLQGNDSEDFRDRRDGRKRNQGRRHKK